MTAPPPARRHRQRRGPGPGSACVLALLIAAGLALSVPTMQRASVASADPAFDARLRALNMVPLAGRLPRSFALPALDGRRFTLGQLTGRAAFLYFWASW